jgi:16S rRNA G966 N2-methylase RsmD
MSNDLKKIAIKYITGELPFPLKRLNYSDNDICSMFNKLKKYSYDDRLICDEYYCVKNLGFPKIDYLFKGRPMLLLSKKTDYEDFNILSDMFNEINRLKARRYDSKLSPYDYFYKNIEEVIKYSQTYYKKTDPASLRESLYHLSSEATSFRPTNIMFAIQFFKCKNVLDFSAGWGDRLIGAMAAGVKYTGVDPNSNLFPKYKEMIDFFADKPQNYVMINSPIETAKLEKETYDLVFTSPPYFDLEIYSEEKTQSVAGMPSERKWFDNFLKVAIKKVYDALDWNGYLVIIINQKNNKEYYVKWMLDYAASEFCLHYYGVISYANERKIAPQPMWIWRKSKMIPEDLYNPPLIINKYDYASIPFCVVRDDYLIGGTKQRGLVPMMGKILAENNTINDFIYAGPPQGYAQIALAYAAKLHKVNATIFVFKLNKMHNFTRYAKHLGAKIVEIKADLVQLQKAAKQYCNKKKQTRYLLPFGFESKDFRIALEKSLKKVSTFTPKRIWLVAGSATTLNVLYEVFPSSEFVAVQVGKKIWPDMYNKDNTKLIISDEKFINPAKILPPYKSVASYDAKLWKYFTKKIKRNDYIWNIGKDIPNHLF